MSTRTSLALPMLVLVLFAGVGCDDDDDPFSPPGPFRLTFSLDATFQPLHGGQSISIALVRSTDGFVVAQKSGTVSATEEPSFFFNAGQVLEKGTGYEVHYWIDSDNDGICDPKITDHQWSVEFPSPTNDVRWTASHNPALTEEVCDTFD